MTMPRFRLDFTITLPGYHEGDFHLVTEDFTQAIDMVMDDHPGWESLVVVITKEPKL